eukprot:TRINITY_DN4690_c0_g3_i1.p3 TRINITY_DN4690_c0_g3~~TRINITY_DN4690_c0_g3_i1.p3  ORF type:complete len:100 (+),score=12.61 TRINITY_DN4690_c0_g3_i1:434-733(+)
MHLQIIRPREAKINDPKIESAPACKENVFRLQVAVDDAQAIKLHEAIDKLLGDDPHLTDLEALSTLSPHVGEQARPQQLSDDAVVPLEFEAIQELQKIS